MNDVAITPVQGTVYSDVESPTTLVGKADEAYDEAMANPPRRGWTANQLDRIDEIKALEAKGNLTLAEQLRLTELKLGIANEAGTITGPEYNLASSTIDNTRDWLNRAMTTGYNNTKLLNNLMAMFEVIGVNTAGSPLAAKRDALLANPEMPLADGLRFHAQHHTQMAESYAEGSAERESHLNRAEYLNSAAEMMMNHSGDLGSTEITDYENITFANLDAIDQDMLEAEAAFFQGLAEARELELRANSDDPNALVNDPLLNYYRGREALATNTAAELSAGSNEMDRLNTRMGYLKQISQMDQTYYSEMAEVAKLNGDADSQRTFESQASQASDREGQISRSWQTLMNMLSQGMIDANK